MIVIKLMIYEFESDPSPRGFAGIGASVGEARNDAVKQMIAKCDELGERFTPSRIVLSLQQLPTDAAAVVVRNDWLSGFRYGVPLRPFQGGVTRYPAILRRINNGKNHRGQAALPENGEDQRSVVRQDCAEVVQEVEAGA